MFEYDYDRLQIWNEMNCPTFGSVKEMDSWLVGLTDSFTFKLYFCGKSVFMARRVQHLNLVGGRNQL